ncbi:MAG: serine/threonine-protein kinase [Pseudomonadota bacterium]
MLEANDIITLAAGRYRLRTQLGGSAYGVVWRAQSPSGADVALKLVNREQMARAHPALQERWSASALKEIAFLRSLAPWDERHIVRLLDSGIHDGLPVMALELMETDLARHLAAGHPIALDRALAWTSQVNQALAKVHQYGWLYLDLKPANVLTSSGAVKLADFGTSRLRSEAPASAYAGTASWQAPEQFFPTASGTYDTDARSDYFALGAMFYYLVTGGLQLRFCSNCGHAYRDDPSNAAGALLSRHAGRLPPTLHADEAELFMHRVGHADATACAALAMLRALLAADRSERPQHAIHISRRIRASTPAWSAA